MTPLKRQMMIVFISFLACILAIGVCCSVSRSQQITVSPPVDQGIQHHEVNEFHGEIVKGQPTLVMVEGGSNGGIPITVPKGSYIVVITPPPQPLVLETQDPKKSPFFDSNSDNRSMVGGGVPPLPTFLVTSDKAKSEITVTAWCPAGYLIERDNIPSRVSAPEMLQATLNSKCAWSRFVSAGDITPMITFTLNLQNWLKEKK